MRVYDHFPYKGKEQHWAVPQGVTQALFECWGAAGGMSSGVAHVGKTNEVVGGTAAKNDRFYNNPRTQGNLGSSFANNAGYAAGIRTVTAGDVFYIYVGGNGGPGHSSIRLKNGGNIETKTHGGDGGWNGGGNGGDGAKTTQNLYNSASTQVHYTQSAMPNSAKSGQLWLDTTGTPNTVKKCNTTYTSGGGSAAKWDVVTNTHNALVGPSGGGGGGATDIRHGSNALSARILVAGGSGGSVGPWVKSGKASWNLQSVPNNPAPPFGSDSIATGATGPDKTWTTNVNYFQGGWGGGGIGGGKGPRPNAVPSTGSGVATTGDSGGPATARHQDGSNPHSISGSGGKGGDSLVGGTRGNGGTGGQSGSAGNGGNGADAVGVNDDFCAGGGGGGGGWFGGGGGGQGFKVTGQNSDVHTRGGGGGGGSNYADPSLAPIVLTGAAQPPFAKNNAGTGANGLGGFCRISYDLPPSVVWSGAPSTALASTGFTVGFTYKPAKTNGAGIAYYIIGSATSPAATSPTSQTTVMVTDATLTAFSYAGFTAPAAGVSNAYFVQVFDTDGDGSGWLKQIITGMSSGSQTGATITSPAAGATATGTSTVTWTVGTQTPLVAYRLGYKGNSLANGAVYTLLSGWRRGGSRVNLATDPGFQGTAVWSSTNNTALASTTTFPGVSGHSGRISWTPELDGGAEQHTVPLNNLIIGQAYRLHLGVASSVGIAASGDPRPVEIQVWDNSGLLTTAVVSLLTSVAGTPVVSDVVFTPQAQGVYFVVVPSGSTPDAPSFTDDFEGTGAGSLDTWAANAGFTATFDATQTYQGGFALKVVGAGTAAASKTVAPTAGVGWYVLSGWGFTAAGSDRDVTLGVAGAGVNGGAGATASNPTRGAMVPITVPFYWNGTGTVTLSVYAAVTTSASYWYDYISVSPYSADSDPTFGNTDSNQIHYLTDMLVELVYEQDSAGYGAYFDGSHANGTGLTATWSGTTNASPSYGTGTNILTDSVSYTGGPYSNGEIDLWTLAEANEIVGDDGALSTVSVVMTPSVPATPTVTLHVNTAGGTMDLTITAADGAKTNKTVYFDIFRNGSRIATGLTPDQSTRVATYSDIPAQGDTPVYVVRALDSNGGYTDQATGTII